MTTLYLDCFSGISGDMTVGALRDLGVPEEVFRRALAQLGLDAEFCAEFHRGSRQGISGWKFDVTAKPHFQIREPRASLLRTTFATPGHAHGRDFRAIRALLEASSLSPFVKHHALGAFRRIAVAEGRIHGQPPDEVGFHEVGAIDSIVDLVAACAGLEAVGAKKIVAAPLVEGCGWIDCAHGRFPLPAPATLEILRGIPLRQRDQPHELITPTGAALVAEFATEFGPLPELRVDKTGYGLGSRDVPPSPNVLRLVLGQNVEDSEADTDEIVQIECNLDDSTPELAGAAMDRLFAAGALDVFFTAAQMKKNRPGWILTVLAPEREFDSLARLILTETTAFGLRYHRTRRMKLRRVFREVETPHGPVQIKLGYLGKKLVQTTPEYQSCEQLAAKSGLSVRAVYLAALQAIPPGDSQG